ncbi:NAD-dependent protein deacylase [Diplonema papillatum]|nr:NAD-dependent protein deacylase [Diplonema papillatum]
MSAVDEAIMKQLEAIVPVLKSAKHVVFMTGAGISAESNIPTFRDAQDANALWSKYEPHDLATADAFLKDPLLVTRWYAWRRSLCTKAQPNAGHFAITEMLGMFPRATLITQNVDGLHARAGAKHLLELHGTLLTNRCFVCGKSRPAPDVTDVQTIQEVEKCDECHTERSMMRPNVVWFQESLDDATLAAAYSAAEECDVFFSIGTSSVVYPAADLAFRALQNGKPVVEVNPSRTPLTTSATHFLQGPSGVILKSLVDLLKLSS